jgi:hypothetical protein
MKKIIALLSIVLLTIVSCSEDSATEVILPKRVVSSGGSEPRSTLTLSYNGNKLNEINREDGKSIYTYSGDLIVKEENFKGARLTSTRDYTYESNNLKSYIEISNNLNASTGNITINKKKYVFTYNPNGTVLEEIYDIDNATSDETKRSDYITRTYSNGNLIKEVEFNYGGSTNSSYVYTTTYEYDNKNNPVKNILGLGKVLVDVDSSLNNTLKRSSSEEITLNGVANPPQPLRVRDYQLSYNSDNFLTESKYFNTNTSGSTTRSTQFFYE